MPRVKRTLTEEGQWEQDIEDTVEAIKNGKFSSIRAAARATGLSKTTLGKRLEGRPTRCKAQEARQTLAHVEEEELVRAIRVATMAGRPPLPQTVREMAEGIRKRRVKGVNEDGVVLVDYEPLGKRWPARFMKRQMNLRMEKAEKIEAVRNEVSMKDLEKWFVELERVVQEFDILLENIYNMDETGFNIGDFEPRHVIVDTSVQTCYQAQPGRQEWVTAAECICADGSSIPPLMIFTSETFVRQWIPVHFNSPWKFSNNTKGWVCHEHGLQWLKQCFELAT
jgi:hypothetical protein